jgi:hypothetical protein
MIGSKTIEPGLIFTSAQGGASRGSHQRTLQGARIDLYICTKRRFKGLSSKNEVEVKITCTYSRNFISLSGKI